MHFHSFDSYQAHTSPVHELDPRTKTLLTVGFVLAVVLLPDGAWGQFAMSWLMLAIAALLARIPQRHLLTRALLAVPFALAAVSVLFTLPGNAVLALKIRSWTLIMTDAGLTRFITILLRSWLAVQAAVLLTATTQFPDLVHALRHLRVPHLLTAILSFMYRYLFVLADEALRLVRARASRSAGSKDGARVSLLWRARVTGGMIGQLFLRSYDRSERVHNAMLARGYTGLMRTMNPHHMHRTDWLTLTGGLLLLVLILFSGRFPF